ncbi:MAG: hypothetical protein WCJ52_10710 [Phenylobacterium sp.]|uniref:hypothetical protein n=1 Tax=Phenylobacterium sp. TaxID=1871053 RepID=UPI00301723C1
MRLFTLGAAVLAASLCAVSPALAAPVFVDDFQDGKADGWGQTGASDVRLTSYGDNISLRVTGGATAMTSVSTAGFVQLSVAGSLAAMGLGKADACLVEASADDGATWREVVAVRDGADDGVTLTRAALALPDAYDTSEVLIRVRAVGGKRVACWADAVTVTGERRVEAAGPRSALTLDSLTTGPGLSAPVSLAAFAPPPGAVAPPGRSDLRLTLTLSGATLNMTVVHDDTGDTPAELAARVTLPPFDFAFLRDGADLVPVRRGVIVGDHPAWDWVLEPGRVWREEGDRGWLRAAVPFALQEHNANCLHNGVLTFLFKPDGSVSRVALEIASETCAYLKFDAWATVPARLTPAAIPDGDAVIAAWRDQVVARLPVRPLAELARLRPDVNLAAFALGATKGGDPPTAFGLVVDGVHYASACQTRKGDYPFCDVLGLPSYSTAKSIVGGVGLMRLEALHPGSAGALIADHVPACAKGGDWAAVTLANALDMATGVYGSTAFEADENAPAGQVFFNVEDSAAKAAYACGHFHRRAAPGTTFVYRTADTYLLGTAMSDILRRSGEGDLYDDLVAPLWRSLKLSPTIMGTRRTYDAVRQPFTGWGLTYHRDDILRIAGWLRDGAVIDGRPVLDPGLLKAALQRDPAHPGLPASGPAYRYKAGFWARDISGPLGCSRPVWAPFMSGYGGISVVLLPGGVTYYYFGDSGVFDWAPAALEAGRIRNMCS